MSILHYYLQETDDRSSKAFQDRYRRDALIDMKRGMELIFELKAQLDSLHPIASETLIKMIS